MQRVLGLFLFVILIGGVAWAVTTPADCDLTSVSFGCPSLIDTTAVANTSAVFNIAVAAARRTIPLRVLSVEQPEVMRVQTINASETRCVLETSNHEARIALDDFTGALRIEALSVAWVTNGTVITIDVTSGCLLVNGTLPPKSPCLNLPLLNNSTGANGLGITPSPPAELNAWDGTIASILVPTIVGIIGFLIGFAIACPLGMCAQRRRTRRHKEAHANGSLAPKGGAFSPEAPINLDDDEDDDIANPFRDDNL